MTITPQELIAILPLMIVGLTAVVVMLSIAWRRDHLTSAALTVSGFVIALFTDLGSRRLPNGCDFAYPC